MVIAHQYVNQQIKKWINRWKPVIDHSMKQVKELAKENSKPIWKHFTASKQVKTKESRKLRTRKQTKEIPLTTNVYTAGKIKN